MAETPQEKKRQRKQLRRQLVVVRQKGLDDFQPDAVPSLRDHARRLIANGSDRERIEAALRLVVEDYFSSDKFSDPLKMKETTELWFGLDPKTRTVDHKERHKVAAQRAGWKLRTMEVSGADKILTHLSNRLAVRVGAEGKADRPSTPAPQRFSPVDEPTPVLDAPARPAPTKGSRRERSFPTLRRGKRLIRHRVEMAAMAILILVTFWAALTPFIENVSAPGALDPSKEVPPRGTVIDAATGDVAQQVNRQPNKQGAYISGGGLFRACNLESVKGCEFSLDQPPPISDGDVVKLGVRLHNPAESPLPYATLVMTRTGFTGSSGSSRRKMTATVHANLTIDWPGSGRQELGPIYEELKLPATPYGYASLSYIPGSTVLEDENSRFLAHLPDGIMEDGVALANVGSPASCFSCDLKYRRYVFFKARVGVNPARRPQ